MSNKTSFSFCCLILLFLSESWNYFFAQSRITPPVSLLKRERAAIGYNTEALTLSTGFTVTSCQKLNYPFNFADTQKSHFHR